MSYLRVIPRDLFNEADLLKCLGKLWILTERHSTVTWEHAGEDRPFMVEQAQEDGSIYVANILMRIKGRSFDLYRPLNSRDQWPLWIRDAQDPEFEDFKVFDLDHHGQLSDEFLRLIEVN